MSVDLGMRLAVLLITAAASATCADAPISADMAIDLWRHSLQNTAPTYGDSLRETWLSFVHAAQGQPEALKVGIAFLFAAGIACIVAGCWIKLRQRRA